VIRYWRTWKYFFKAPVSWLASSDSWRPTPGKRTKWLVGSPTLTLTFRHLPRALCDSSTAQIAAEQRRAEESLEMRKRMFDDPGDGSETEL